MALPCDFMIKAVATRLDRRTARTMMYAIPKRLLPLICLFGTLDGLMGAEGLKLQSGNADTAPGIIYFRRLQQLSTR